MKNGLIISLIVLLLITIIIVSNAISSADGCPCFSISMEAPSPPNGSTQISVYVTLNWSVCPNASSYYVHFGTTDPPITYNWSASNNGYQIPFQLNYSTKYYWQTIAYNATCNTSGPVWNFTTSEAPPPTPTATLCVIPKPQSPSPANLSTVNSTSVVLYWNTSANASWYEVCYDSFSPPGYKGIAYSNNYSLPQLNINTKYYWQVIARNNCGLPSGSDIWNFTTGCPLAPNPQNPSPINGSDQISINPYLSWNGSSNASYYSIYFGTSTPPQYSGNTSNSSFQLPKLNSNTRYYWKVAAGNACGNNSSDTWYFTTGCPYPGIPQEPYPANSSNQASIYTNLRWNASPNASYYEVYFGTSESPDINGSIGSTLDNSYPLPKLNVSTKYYWKIIAKNECGMNSSNIWNFTTGCPVSDRPQIPSPLNGSDQISIYTRLSWNTSPNATSYDIYFGTLSPPSYYGNTSNSSFLIPKLNTSTKYYWRVAANNACGNNSSDLWYFTTGNASAPLTVNISGTTSSYVINGTGVLQQDMNMSSPDGSVNLNISSGTVMRDEDEQPLGNLSIIAIDSLPSQPTIAHILASFDCQPDGATFNPGIVITYTYNPDDIPSGMSENDIFIGIYNSESHKWQYLSGILNKDANTIILTAEHFTIFSILALPGGAPNLTTSPTLIPSSSPAITPTGVDKEGSGWLWIALGLDAVVTTVMLVVLYLAVKKRGEEAEKSSTKRLNSIFRLPGIRRSPKPPKSS